MASFENASASLDDRRGMVRKCERRSLSVTAKHGHVEESMRHAVLGAAFPLSVCMAVLSFGCSAPPPAANSFSEVYSQIIQPKCSSDYCHYNGISFRYGNLDMSSQAIAYWNLVGQPCDGPACTGMGLRVVPHSPEASIMYLKVSQTSPPCGVQMPANPYVLTLKGGSAVFSGTPLTAEEQQLIYNWIQEGAQNN
jgi:hypothetical protein